MKTLATTLVLSALLFASPVIGHGSGHGSGHEHRKVQIPVNQQVAQKKASEIVVSLVKRQKIDKSWLSTEVSSVEKKKLNGRLEWLITFTNKKTTDTDKQKLYVFLTIAGEYIAANFTGN